MPITETYPQLVRTVDDLRRQWRGQKVLGGVCWTVAAAAGSILVTVALDNWLRPETTGRALLAAGLWLTLAAAVLHWIVRCCLEDRRDDYFAAMVEEKHPELRNQFINALQLGRGNQNGFSPRFIEAIVADATRATADLDVSDSLDRRQVRRAA